jgi:signal transduction histidine kinase
VTPAVLLVDDHEENLVAMEAALAPLDYRVVTATSGEDALRRLLLDDFALVVLDVQMPGIDGFETALAIKGRERTKDVPILFLTAISREEEHRLQGYATGGVDYLFKPISPELLRAKVAVFVELHMKQMEVEAKSAELERSNRDLEQFSYVASHDLQEPLRVVAGYLELIEDHTDEAADDQMRGWIHRAQHTTAQMAGLVDDLLLYARAGSAVTPPTEVSLDRAVSAALDNLELLVRESDAQVRVAKGLPAVRAVEREVVQVLQNVISNAIKHRGESDPEVDISATTTHEFVEVCVADRGRGVAAADAERIFGLFERVDANSPYPGTGLGLAICRRIVERRGGRIWLEPNSGDRGTVVHVTLPVASG